jgi:hypothetical protein
LTTSHCITSLPIRYCRPSLSRNGGLWNTDTILT